MTLFVTPSLFCKHRKGISFFTRLCSLPFCSGVCCRFGWCVGGFGCLAFASLGQGQAFVLGVRAAGALCARRPALLHQRQALQPLHQPRAQGNKRWPFTQRGSRLVMSSYVCHWL
jgi:hypothetical protein